MLAVDVSHPRISAGPKAKRLKKEPDTGERNAAVFAAYMGVPRPSPKPAITTEKLVSLTSLSDEETARLLSSRARDLFEAMVSQVSSSQA